MAMKACQTMNKKSGFDIDIHGIVTNATSWQFYKLTQQDDVFETITYSFQSQMPTLFGILDSVFKTCEDNLPLSIS